MEKNEIKFTDEIVLPVMIKHRISREEAENRLWLLSESGIMANGDVGELETQHMIDDFLSMDSEQAAEKVAFEKCLNQCLENEGLISQYDRLNTKAHMAYTLKQIEGGKMNVKEEREANKQFKMFSDFVAKYIFSRLGENEQPTVTV